MSNITSDQAEAIADLDIATDETTEFGDVARNVLGQQCQYASRYVGGIAGYPDLGGDLRIDGDPTDYHTLRIHKDDVETFVERVNEHRNSL